MLRQSFGRKQSKNALPLPNIIVPAGASASKEYWSLGEALHIFVTDANERSLFEYEDLPKGAIAIFRAYEFINELSNVTVAVWYDQGKKPRPVKETICGLQIIGLDDMAKALIEADTFSEMTCEDRISATAHLNYALHYEESYIGACSEWVRNSPQTLVLGDGKLDTVYKEVMKQLYRCNPRYPERRRLDDEVRERLRLKPVGPPAHGQCSLTDLIEEMQRRYS